MALTQNNKFRVHAENATIEELVSDEELNSDEERTEGYKAGNRIRSKIMNAELRQSTLISTALVQSVLNLINDTATQFNVFTSLDSAINFFETNLTTGIKGSNETQYRHGNVSISKTDIGLSEVVNKGLDANPTSGSNKYVTSGGTFTAIKTHTDKTDNPHSVTKAQVGLGSVENHTMDTTPTQSSNNYVKSGGVFSAIKTVNDALTSHKNDKANPHAVTKAQVGLDSVINQGMDNVPTKDSVKYVKSNGVYTAIQTAQNTVQGNLNTHTGNSSNPHAVTKSQVGLGSVVNQGMDSSPTKDSVKYVKSGGVYTAINAVTTALTTHTGNKSNPHDVTKTQVGLGNVDNTSDADKPISTATQNALNNKADLHNGKVPIAQLPDTGFTADVAKSLADGSGTITTEGIVNRARTGLEPAFNKNSAFNKNFGDKVDTVCQGNDSRLSDKREASSVSADVLNTAINLLGVGDSDPVDDDYYIAQYAGGGTAATTYHRRPVSKLYNYMKGKMDNLYSALSHNHDAAYSKQGHTHKKSQITDFPTSLPANGGNADTVNGHSVNVDVPSDAKFTDTDTWRPLGTTAETAAKGDHNHDTVYEKLGHTHEYLPLAGGTMTGTIGSKDIIPVASYTYNLGNRGRFWNQAFIDIVGVGTKIAFKNNTTQTKGVVGADDGLEWGDNGYLHLGYLTSGRNPDADNTDGQSGSTTRPLMKYLIDNNVKSIMFGFVANATIGTTISFDVHTHNYAKAQVGISHVNLWLYNGSWYSRVHSNIFNATTAETKVTNIRLDQTINIRISYANKALYVGIVDTNTSGFSGSLVVIHNLCWSNISVNTLTNNWPSSPAIVTIIHRYD